MNRSSITSLREYLGWMSNTIGRVTGKRRIGRYTCIEEFVLKHGIGFNKIGKIPKPHKKGEMGMCYMNATHLAQTLPSLIYCEGYACKIIPVMHAWCVTKDGTVIDPTWDKEGAEYYGVPIKTQYMNKMLFTSGRYGVIDKFEIGWPILKAPVKDFKDMRLKNER